MDAASLVSDGEAARLLSDLGEAIGDRSLVALLLNGDDLLAGAAFERARSILLSAVRTDLDGEHRAAQRPLPKLSELRARLRAIDKEAVLGQLAIETLADDELNPAERRLALRCTAAQLLFLERGDSPAYHRVRAALWLKIQETLELGELESVLMCSAPPEPCAPGVHVRPFS